MANNNVEIEIQVNVERVEVLLTFLKQNGTFQKETHQRDEYFSPTHADYLLKRPVHEWLRLRDADGKLSINYKDWEFDVEGKSHHCKEIETSVGSIEQMYKIFAALQLKSIAVVNKFRKIWTYQDYEIAIDSVEGLGDFVEIEYVGKEDNLDSKKVTADMVEFLKELNCGKITRNYVGYPFLLLFPDEVKYEVM